MNAIVVMSLIILFVFAVAEMTFRLVRKSKFLPPARTRKLTWLYVLGVIEFVLVAKLLI